MRESTVISWVEEGLSKQETHESGLEHRKDRGYLETWRKNVSGEQ